MSGNREDRPNKTLGIATRRAKAIGFILTLPLMKPSAVAQVVIHILISDWPSTEGDPTKYSDWKLALLLIPAVDEEIAAADKPDKPILKSVIHLLLAVHAMNVSDPAGKATLPESLFMQEIHHQAATGPWLVSFYQEFHEWVNEQEADKDWKYMVHVTRPRSLEPAKDLFSKERDSLWEGSTESEAPTATELNFDDSRENSEVIIPSPETESNAKTSHDDSFAAAVAQMVKEREMATAQEPEEDVLPPIEAVPNIDPSGEDELTAALERQELAACLRRQAEQLKMAIAQEPGEDILPSIEAKPKTTTLEEEELLAAALRRQAATRRKARVPTTNMNTLSEAVNAARLRDGTARLADENTSANAGESQQMGLRGNSGVPIGVYGTGKYNMSLRAQEFQAIQRGAVLAGWVSNMKRKASDSELQMWQEEAQEIYPILVKVGKTQLTEENTAANTPSAVLQRTFQTPGDKRPRLSSSTADSPTPRQHRQFG